VKITIIGVTGFTGTHIAREAIARGHDVVGAARSASDHDLEGVEFVALDVADADAVASATATSDALVLTIQPVINGFTLRELVPALLDVAERSSVRLGIVSGAGSLLVADGTRLVDQEAFPEAWRPGAEAHADAFEALRESGTEVDWFVMSPSQFFGRAAPGERRGTYRVGGDELLIDAEGRSSIGVEDFAAALLDELENPKHHRTRFTVGY